MPALAGNVDSGYEKLFNQGGFLFGSAYKKAFHGLFIIEKSQIDGSIAECVIDYLQRLS